jgi:HAD superfamily hydrolase (TIGR01509 family)
VTIRALIFDFDGTIIETEEPEYTSWCEMYAEHGCELPLDLWLEAVGSRSRGFDPYVYLEEQAGRTVDREEVRARRRARLRELVAQQGLRPGIRETLDRAQALGLKLGIASSSSRAWVDEHMAAFDLCPYFATVITGDDVEASKPDPAVYQLALSALKVQPHEAVAIEDSRNGLLAAQAAGIKCIVTPNAITQHLPLDEADLRLTSLADCPLDDLIERLSPAH